MPDIRQSSFSGGEIAPTLWSNTEFKKYPHSLKRCRNFLINQHGAAVNRPGTKFIAKVKNETSANGVRLIPFTFSQDQTFVLEFGDQYVRFIHNGVQIGAPLEYATPFLASELPRLKWAQQGDVITFVHPNHYPWQLKRLVADGTSWSVGNFSVARPACIATTLALQAGQYVQTDPDVNAATARRPPKPWQWVATSIVNGVESLPTPVCVAGGTGLVCVYPDLPAGVAAGWNSTSNTMIISLYRGKLGVFGLVASASVAGVSVGALFTDDGATPDFSTPPPSATDPFAGFVAGQFPTNVAYYTQRLIFSAGGKIWASAVGDYINFDDHANKNASAAFWFNIATQGYEEVRNFLPMRSLMALTNSKDWAIGGKFTYNDLDAKPNNVRGSSWLDPIVAGSTALYVQTAQTSIWELAFNFYEQAYLGSDVTLLAQHLFFNHKIVDWAYAQMPYSIVYAVRDDGNLLGFSYVKEQELAAWHWHDTQGLFENVCAVQEGGETATYVVVNRALAGTNHRFIERFASRIQQDGVTYPYQFLDASVVATGLVGATSISGLGHLEGRQVMVLADNLVLGPYTVTGGVADFSADLPDGCSQAVAGLSYTPEIETLNLSVPGRETRSNVKNIFRVSIEVVASRGLWTGTAFDPVGQEGKRLKEWRQRAVSDSYGAVAPFTGCDHIRFPSTFDHEATVCIRQVDPLPLTVIGIGREVEIGGD